MKITVNGTPPHTRRYLITDAATLEWADDTFTRRQAAIEKTEEALDLIRQIETTLRDAAGYLDQFDPLIYPLIYKILSYPMTFDDTEGCLRDEIREWKQDQNELETEIQRYNALHIETLDNTADD